MAQDERDDAAGPTPGTLPLGPAGRAGPTASFAEVVANANAQELDFHGTPRFQIERVLGAGGMGVVYQVWDRERSARVALKTLRAADGYSVPRFKNEFRALANVIHRNLVTLGDLFHEGGQWFFTMELLDGDSFVNHVRSREAAATGTGFDEGRLRAGLAQLIEGLTALHAAGLVHRDVKPSNIQVTADGRVVLLDFGLVAQTLKPESSASIVGTAMYMAPEQARLEPVAPAADWYSVGVVLYEALTGQLPFSGSLLEMIRLKESGDGPRPRVRLATVPADLDQLCAELMRRDPAARPTGAQIAARLGLGSGSGRRPAAPTALVGRQEELAQLRLGFREGLERGRAVTLCVQGESGLGKSTLVRGFLEQLRALAPNAVAFEGRCYERECVPYKAFDGVVDAVGRYLARIDSAFAQAILPRDAQSLACLFPGLRRLPAMEHARSGPVPDRQELRARAFSALRELLERLCARHPVVVWIDDFQWADADSLTLFEYLLRADDPPPLCLVVSLRSGASTAASLASLPGDVRHLVLQPLAAVDTERLARLLLAGSASSEAQACALAEEAAGHPLFLQELVRYAADAGAAPGAGVRLDEALWTRIGRLPPAARAELEVVSVAGMPVREATAARALGMTPEALGSATRLLQAAQLLRGSGPLRTDTIEPYHDRVREAVVNRLGEEAQRSYHRRLADAMEGSGDDDDPEALVGHLLAAGEVRRAAAHAERAAAHASSLLAFDQAIELYRRAVRLERDKTEGDPAKLRALQRSLGEALANAGRGAEAAREYQTAAEGADPVEATDLQRLACEQLLMSGHLEQGLAAAKAVLESVGLTLPDSPRAALWSLLRARARLKLRGWHYRVRPEQEIDRLDLVRIDCCWSGATGLSTVDFIRAVDFATRQLLLALDAGEPTRIARALANEASFSAAAGTRSRRRTAQLVARAALVADQVAAPKTQADAAFAAGSVAFLEGRWRHARQHLLVADGIYRGRCTGVTWEIDSVHINLVVTLGYLGELKELGERVREYLRVAEERGDLYGAMHMSTGEANQAWLAADDPQGARRQADAARSRYSDQSVIARVYLDAIAQTRIDLYLGEHARAQADMGARWDAFKGAMLHKVQLLRIVMTNLRGTVALTGAAASSALDRQAARDARDLRRTGSPCAAALASLLDAGLYAARGDRTRALARYSEAALQLDEVDMAAHAACARLRQGELVGGAPGEALLTRARQLLVDQAIKDPERFAAVIAPRV